VEGRFKTRQFEGRDGQTRTALEITADSIVNLERRPREDDASFGGQDQGYGGGQPVPATSPTRQPESNDFDDLPF